MARARVTSPGRNPSRRPTIPARAFVAYLADRSGALGAGLRHRDGDRTAPRSSNAEVETCGLCHPAA